MTHKNGSDFNFSGKNINIEQIQQEIQNRLDSYSDTIDEIKTPEEIARTLRMQMIGEFSPEMKQDNIIQLTDTDIVPRHYIIGWRIPIIGHINAIIRRVINAEIRRYLLPSLVKQSVVNQRLLEVVETLSKENKQLHQEIDKIKIERES